ncbi:hypothetical protein [Acidovorax sp. sic0104]|uniref:hypothetical protein n=1 Tax=Acidovorax sp. sic0104 TaxID=2854784 RepID=UPI001C45AEA1|nr:hypothetical protein [Acidovorax sp. sic0104]MBV7542032.1 hypothetical protein [Acidovorax sp. sic0104]
MQSHNTPITRTITSAQFEILRASVEAYKELLACPTSACRDAHGDAWADVEIAACDALLKSQLACVRAPEGDETTARTTASQVHQESALWVTTTAFLALLRQADSVSVNQKLLQHWETAEANADAGNQVVRFCWTSEGYPFAVALTQEGIANGEWRRGAFICADSEGDIVELVLSKHMTISPAAAGLSNDGRLLPTGCASDPLARSESAEPPACQSAGLGFSLDLKAGTLRRIGPHTLGGTDPMALDIVTGSGPTFTPSR